MAAAYFQLAMAALLPFLYMGPQPGRKAAALLSFFLLFFSAFFIWHPPASTGILAPVWLAGMFLLAVLENMVFWRFYGTWEKLEPSSRGRRASSQAEEAAFLRKKLDGLKTTLHAEEHRLKEALRSYNVILDLAECLGYDQMKRVLERELKSGMPYLSGFVLYARHPESGVYEPRVRSRLWLEGERWTSPESFLLQSGVWKTVFCQEGAKNYVAAPVGMGPKPLGYFIGELSPFARHEKPADILAAASLLGGQLQFGLMRASSFAKVEELSRIDSLTGLHRRGVFDQRIREELVRASTFKNGVGLMMLDIDHFKHINDEGGHLFGDAVLKRVASIVAQSVYETDFVARYGGEEFAVLLPRTEEEGALRKAESIRRRVEQEVFKSEDSREIRVTISVGVAFFPKDARAAENLISRADEALYFSKTSGRNRVTPYSALGRI